MKAQGQIAKTKWEDEDNGTKDKLLATMVATRALRQNFRYSPKFHHPIG
jgi:hypothetical protein